MKFPTSTLNEYFKRNSTSKGIISVWGDFGVGKTTFALQTSLNTLKELKKIIYIYTKPIFPTEKIGKLAGDSSERLKDITFIRPENFEDLHNIVFNLEFLILRTLNKIEKPYKLIIIDSLTDLYRLELNRTKKEKNYNLNYNLNQILANLSFIKNAYDIEILVINEKTQIKEENQIKEIQSGGKVMEYWVSNDIKIERTEKLRERKFILTTHPSSEFTEFTSKLSENGF
ncbi:MAG: AAA family ATPase [Promethearchaeota archaeon]|jgi:RecA/RadA recombinase